MSNQPAVILPPPPNEKPVTGGNTGVVIGSQVYIGTRQSDGSVYVPGQGTVVPNR